MRPRISFSTTGGAAAHYRKRRQHEVHVERVAKGGPAVLQRCSDPRLDALPVPQVHLRARGGRLQRHRRRFPARPAFLGQALAEFPQ
jgi:hypothetical protein